MVFLKILLPHQAKNLAFWYPLTHQPFSTWYTVGCCSLWQSLNVVCHTEWMTLPPVGVIWLHGSASWCCIHVKLTEECEVCVRLHLLLDLCLLPQGFDDQPGVEPQWFLSAQRRHHLLQSVTIQLDDLQVETGSWGLQSPQPLPLHCPYHQHRSQLSSYPSSSSLDSVPIAQPVSMELKHACTNRRQRI